MKKKWQKALSLMLIICMISTIIPDLLVKSASAKTAGSDFTPSYKDIPFMAGGSTYSTFINKKIMPTLNDNFNISSYDAFRVFHNVPSGRTVDGIRWTSSDGDNADNDGVTAINGHYWGVIDVSSNPSLKKLAEGGKAYVKLFAGYVDYCSSQEHDTSVWLYTTSSFGREEEGRNPNAKNKWTCIANSGTGDRTNQTSGWIPFEANELIVFEVEMHGDANGGVTGMKLAFADIEAPSIKNYTFTSTGTERLNTKINQKELFLKKNESMTLKYSFSEPIDAVNSNKLKVVGDQSIPLHKLFTIPTGNGLPADGESKGLSLDAPEKLSDSVTDISFSYTAGEYHHTGNNPIANGGELYASSVNDLSLMDKINETNFVDGAGNPLEVSSSIIASDDSRASIKGKTVNPFTYGAGLGYRVIVDAVPPKYTFAGNGIQPEILTGLVLNKGDHIDFTVQLTEDAIVKDGCDPTKVFLYFNNGMKAYYVSGSDTSNWKFRVDITGEENINAPLLKCIALTNDEKGDSSDKNVIQDYAGNLLVDAANTAKGEPCSDTSKQVPMTKIDWAKLAIDNTCPIINFRYEKDGASDTVYRKSGKITIDAQDPALTVPALDPDLKDPDPKVSEKTKPSKGIYRPGNMTGITSVPPALGIVYYYWSQSADNPLASKTADNFAAVKRYSLTGEQPQIALYPGELSGFELMSANNSTNMIAPPEKALKAETSGIWYLHTWTADMSWDSARELMQYEKMKTYKSSHQATYDAWKAEYLNNNPGASEADQIIYADKMAMDSVGNYKDTNVWTLDDYKREDSNWIYGKTAIKLDNLKPEIKIGEVQNNDSPSVSVKVDSSDIHSGIKETKFQWVKQNEEATEIAWKDVPVDGVVATLNNVIEDGIYILYVKAVDAASNETTSKDTIVKVNSVAKVQTKFTPDSDMPGVYSKGKVVKFSINGIEPEKVEFVYTKSAEVADTDAFADITTSVQVENDYKSYIVPLNNILDGTYYLHIKVKEKGRNMYYNYSKLYNFDNTAPEVTFSTTGVSYPKETHNVTVTVDDSYSKTGMIKKYQWVKTDIAPVESSNKWIQLPANGVVTIDNSELSVGETANYKLYVYAIDGVNNSIIKGTDTFKVYKKNEQGDIVIPETKPDLIYVYGDPFDGFYAVVKLELNIPSKEKVYYAIQINDAEAWTQWKPYSNFAEIKVPIKNVNEVGQIKLKVRYKSPKGLIGNPIELNTSTVSKLEPVYAVASQSSYKPVSVSKGAVLDIKVPAGVKVIPSAENPMVPIHTVNTNKFTVTQNGCYSFELTDMADTTRKNTLLVVVDNVDDTIPSGSISYSITGKTNCNVIATLDTSEDVRITSIGNNKHVFTENGVFNFEFEDEAGNKGIVTATVANIDKTPPSATIAKTYTYGKDGSQIFKTIKDKDGNVILTQGVTLSVQKTNPADKDFIVVGGNSSVTVQKNGLNQFNLQDLNGNTLLVTEDTQNIVSFIPNPTSITYTFVDAAGNNIPANDIKTINGKKYAKGKVKVTISGKVDKPNLIFQGAVPVKDSEDKYTNCITDNLGNYTFTRTLSANGEIVDVISDLLGNQRKLNLAVEGIDNKAPSIVLNQPIISVQQGKLDFNPVVDLGGFVVKDNVSLPENINIKLSSLDINKQGKQLITYTVTDEVGNTTEVTQTVYVFPNSGMLALGNQTLLSAASNEIVMFEKNKINFTVTRYDLVDIGGKKMVNQWAKYDIYYKTGLYREGQMKYIAKKITLQELTSKNFIYEFPEVGWYTIIIRNQEREREYMTFFIGKISTDDK